MNLQILECSSLVFTGLSRLNHDISILGAKSFSCLPAVNRCIVSLFQHFITLLCQKVHEYLCDHSHFYNYAGDFDSSSHLT